MKRAGRVVTSRIEPAPVSIAVAKVFGRSLPVLETRALIKKGKRIASTTLKGRA